MADVFDALLELVDEHAQLRRVQTLMKGTLYSVSKFEIQEQSATAYRSVKAFIMDEGIKFFVYLPKKFCTMTGAQIQALNDRIKANEPPTICYYGTLGKANIVEIHRFGEKPKQAQLERIAKLEKLMGENEVSPTNVSPMKRSNSNVDTDCHTPDKKIVLDGNPGPSNVNPGPSNVKNDD